MAGKTTNYGWTKPEANDWLDIGVISEVFENIDEQMKAVEEAAGESKGLKEHIEDKNNPHGVTPWKIGARVNQNLLDNWYFADPINRKGLTEYVSTLAAGIVTIDRWRARNGGCTVTVGDDAVKVTNTSSSYSTYFDQLLKNPVKGQVVASVLVKSISGKGYLQPVYADGSYAPATALKVGLTTLVLDPNKEVSRMFMQVNLGSEIEFIAAKLERGTEQTLAHQDENGNWVLNEIPNYVEEVVKCVQYDVSTDNYVGIPTIIAGTTDLVAGTSSLTTGTIYQKYE